MVGTRSTRSKPAAAGDPLVELPVTKRKPTAGKKRRGEEIDQPISKGSPNKGDDFKMDMQTDGASDKMEVDLKDVGIRAAHPAETSDGTDIITAADEPADVKSPVLGTDGVVHDAGNGNGNGTTAQEASPESSAAPPSPKPKILGPRGSPYDPPLHIRTPGARPLVPLGYLDEWAAEAATANYSAATVRRSGRKRLFPRPGQEPYCETPPEESFLDKVMSKKASSEEEDVPENVSENASEKAMPQVDGGDDEIIDDDSDWEEEYLMSNPKSIYGSNLQDFFNAAAWDKISDADKAHLMKYLPECDKVYQTTFDVTDATPPKAELVDGFWENPQLVTRISQVEYDISEGKYTSANQKAVSEARKRAQAGEFDKFKENKFEAFWGQKQRVEYNVVAGDTSSVKLQTLAKHSALCVGDVFSLRRSFNTRAKGNGGITIEKDAKLTAIDPEDFSLTFSYPPGRLQVSSDDKPDKVIAGVVSITALESLLCKEDGRAPAKLPNGNAFKTIRIKRNEQDIGSLFDVRMEFYAKYLSPKA